MLKVNATLPAGAVLGQVRQALADVIHPAGGIWFQGQHDRFDMDGDTVTGWQSNTLKAIESDPNKGNCTLSGTSLKLTSETHCGFVAPRITTHGARCSMAVIYTPQPGDEPRTLLTLNTVTIEPKPDVNNYLFLSQAADGITLKDTQGGIGLQTQVQPASGKRLAIITLSGGQLALAQGLSDPVTIKGESIGFDGAADLFIGCRSHRRGLKKTLGNALIHDVMFWPDHTLLIPRGPADVAQYTALKRFHLWNAA